MKMIALDRTGSDAVGLFPEATLIPDSAITLPGRPLFVPDFAPAWEARILVGARVSRLGKGMAVKFAPRYYDALTLLLRLYPSGGDFPGALASAFDGCVMQGEWLTEGIDTAAPIDIAVGGSLTTLTPAELALDEAVAAVGRYLTIRNGDIIAPLSVGAPMTVAPGDVIEASLAGRPCLKARLK